jgi:heptosyltransferase-2
MRRAVTALREIRRRRYDAIIDFEQQSLLTAAFSMATSIPIRVGFDPPIHSPRSRMFTHAIPLREQASMWNAFVRLGRVLDPGLPESLMTVPLPYSEVTEAWVSGWWKARVSSEVRGPVVAMHLGVGPSAQYRRWPIERFAELANALVEIESNLTVVLTGAKSEQPLIADFQRLFAGRIIDASDLGGLEHTAALLHRCDLLVSGDTGIMHFAAAMGTPTVGLFGPNTPVCWAPVGPRATYVYPTRQPCSPCINSYRRQIPERCTAARESACMWDIGIDDVLNAAKTVIRGSWI